MSKDYGMRNSFENCKDKRSIAKGFRKLLDAVVIYAIAVSILLCSSGVIFHSAMADENQSESKSGETTSYRVDDVRSLLGAERKCGNIVKDQLSTRARTMTIPADQLERIENVLGEFQEVESENVKMLKNLAEKSIEGYQTAMGKGYSVYVVKKYFLEAEKNIQNYETVAKKGFTTTAAVTTQAELDALLADIVNYVTEDEQNVVIGEHLGFDMVSPIILMKVAKAFEDTKFTEEGTGVKIDGTVGETVFRTAGMSDSKLYAMFDGTVSKIEDSTTNISSTGATTKIITIKSGSNFSVSYRCTGIKNKVEVGTPVKQGDVIATYNGVGYGDALVGITVELDGEKIDVLRLYGAAGAVMKMDYVNTYGFSDVQYDLLEDVKNEPDPDVVDDTTSDYIVPVLVE